MSKPSTESLEGRIDTIEGAYEFMLAYAAQGLSGDEASAAIGEAHRQLGLLRQGLEGLAEALRSETQTRGLQPGPEYAAFADVVERDANNTLAAVKLALAQPTISSQLVDNLNALIHLRALLTDLFLVDEILKPGQADA